MLESFHVVTPNGHRNYSAENSEHAKEQHVDAFRDELNEDERILEIHRLDECNGV